MTRTMLVRLGRPRRRTSNNRGDTDFGARRPGRPFGFGDHRGRGPPAHQQSERQNRRGEDEADSGIGRPPADQRDRQTHQQGPDRACEVIARRDDDHRESAPPDEPVEISAISGPKPVPVPTPISTWAAENTMRFGAAPARMKPRAWIELARTSGTAKPGDPPCAPARSSRRRDRPSSGCRATRPRRGRRRIRLAPAAGRQ